MAKKKKKKKSVKRRIRKSGVSLPFGKWLKGPFRLRKNGRRLLVDMKH